MSDPYDIQSHEYEANLALAHALWVEEGNTDESAIDRPKYIERAKVIREWLRVNNHDVKCLNCDLMQDHWDHT